MAERRLARALGAVIAIVLAVGAAPPAPAQQQRPPERETQPREVQRPKPDFAELERIRFLTDDDYPPFNYLDEDGSLTGFNVDLARALCDELSVECDVRSIDWGDLIGALENGAADALAASLRPSTKTLAQLDFTDPYYHTPARFVALKGSPLRVTTPEALKGQKIAVIAGTAHEAFLKDFYPGAGVVPFESAAKAEEALVEKSVDILFGDGITLMFWLNGTKSQGCCEFRGGAYADSKYFGQGVGIAVKRGNRKLRAVLDYGLDRLRADGRLEELYLRYFPLSFF